MENKYYTPDIEDIRVGYEGEIQYENVWHKTIIKEDGLYRANWKYRIEKNIFRVSYLTKEQIEAEGWNQEGESPNDYLYNFVKIKETEFHKSGWRLTYYKNDKWLAPIELRKWYDRNGAYDAYEGWGESFSFECPSINEFRIICKLLNIN